MIEKIIYDKSIKLERNVSCIGYFDGVHRGHQALISKTVDIAKKKNLKPCIITFYPDPYEVINKKKNLQISNFKQRMKHFEELGIEKVIVINFDEDIMYKSYSYFNSNILNNLNIDTLICGYDFTYGYKAQGNKKTLKECKFNVCSLKEVTYYGKKISSSRIRKEIMNKNYKLVNKLLGYEYK